MAKIHHRQMARYALGFIAGMYTMLGLAYCTRAEGQEIVATGRHNGTEITLLRSGGEHCDKGEGRALERRGEVVRAGCYMVARDGSIVLRMGAGERRIPAEAFTLDSFYKEELQKRSKDRVRGTM